MYNMQSLLFKFGIRWAGSLEAAKKAPDNSLSSLITSSLELIEAPI